MPDLTFRQLQEEHAAWATRNFGAASPPERCLLGVVEEIGELCHAQLKWLQNIRGTREEHEAAARDAVGDVVIYLADFCSRSGYDLDACVQDAWDEVKARDWLKHTRDGTTA